MNHVSETRIISIKESLKTHQLLAEYSAHLYDRFKPRHFLHKMLKTDFVTSVQFYEEFVPPRNIIYLFSKEEKKGKEKHKNKERA